METYEVEISTKTTETLVTSGGYSNADDVVVIESWNNTTRSVVTSVEKMIPMVGGLLSFITQCFWPEKKISIWESIKKDVYHAIDKSILQKEIEERTGDLNGIMKALKQCQPEKGKVENAIAFGNAIAGVITLKEKIKASSNDVQLIPIMVNIAHLHLGLYRERLTHGLDIFGVTNEDKRASSVKIWHKELVNEYDDYKKYFDEIYDEWLLWRSAKIEVVVKNSKKATVNDTLLEKIYEYKFDKKSHEMYLNTLTYHTKQRIISEAKLEITRALSLTYTLNLYLPNEEQFDLEKSLDELGYNSLDKSDTPVLSQNLKSVPIEKLQEIIAGPFCFSTTGSFSSYGSAKDHDLQIPNEYDSGDKIEAIEVYERAGFKAIYSPDISGHLFYKESRLPHLVSLPEQIPNCPKPHFTGIGIPYYDTLNRGVVPIYYTGEQTEANLEAADHGVYANGDKLFHAGPSYELVQFAYSNGSGGWYESISFKLRLIEDA